MTAIPSLTNVRPTTLTNGRQDFSRPHSPWGGGNAVASGTDDQGRADEGAAEAVISSIVAQLLAEGWERVAIGDNTVA
jgi:hypothetical protein